jgi:hypothetical protein
MFSSAALALRSRVKRLNPFLKQGAVFNKGGF